MQGDNKLECGADGTWTGTFPSCIGIFITVLLRLKKWWSLAHLGVGFFSSDLSMWYTLGKTCLEGNCHGDLAVLRCKLRKHLSENVLSYTKLLLERRQKNIPSCTHLRPNHPQPNIIYTSFCTLLRLALLVTKLNHYCNYSPIQIHFLALQSDTQKKYVTLPPSLPPPLFKGNWSLKFFYFLFYYYSF